MRARKGADSTVPLVKGGRRQYSAIATFDDGSTQDVSARSTWTAANTNFDTTRTLTVAGAPVTNFYSQD